jgi:hypothetical protein
MTKRKIKVVKRDAPVQPPPVPEPKPVVDTDRGISNAVKSWITERRKNSEAEQTSDEVKFVGWQDLNNSPNEAA